MLREWGSMLRQQQVGWAEARADAAASAGRVGHALPQAEATISQAAAAGQRASSGSRVATAE